MQNFNSLKNDLQSEKFQMINLDLYTDFENSQLEPDFEKFVTLTNSVKVNLLQDDHESISKLLKDFMKRLIEKILLNLVYDTMTIEYKEALSEAMHSLSNDEKLDIQMKNNFTYDENFINFSLFMDSKYYPSYFLENTIQLILKIKLHMKYCKITVDISSLEIIYKIKERFGLKLNENFSSQFSIDKNNTKSLIKEINLTQKLNNDNLIRFYIEYPIKEIDNLRICFNNLIFYKQKFLPRRQAKKFSREGYIYMMATKNPMNFGCQNCLNEDNEKIFQVKFREFEGHNCRIHICKKCVDELSQDDCTKDCLSCDEFLLNFYCVEKIYHYHLVNK